MEENTLFFDYPEQAAYTARVKELVAQRYGENPTACVLTYGCQQNFSDSEKLKGMLEEMGYTLVKEPDGADFVIFNTCAVREHAEDRVFGNVGAVKNYKRHNPKMIAAICGCMAQQQIVADRIKKSFPYVDILFGTHVQHRLPEFIYNRLNGAARIFETSTQIEKIPEGLPVHRDDTLKGWLPVMYGCDNFCTYCIVPYVRGRERSRSPEAVVAEAESMVKQGIKDITLLGQNVNSYGKGESHGVTFAKLLRMVNDIPGDFRIRFMTSHPKDCTIELLEAIRDCDKVCEHIHLPFQSGSSEILKRMNRHYDRETYLELIKNAKKIIPNVSLTSDIIVGFPGETYENFKETLTLIEEVRFDSLFTFIYSPRHGTPAATYEDNVTREEKGIWFRELLKKQEEIAKLNEQKHIGKVYRVLCEDYGNAEGTYSGHSDTNMVVEFYADENPIGKFVNVKINSVQSVLHGEQIKE